MKVKYINKGLEDNLTIGKVYEVLSVEPSVPNSDNKDYLIKDDTGNVDRFMSEFFTEIKE